MIYPPLLATLLLVSFVPHGMCGAPQIIKLPMKSSLQHTLILHTCVQNLSQKLLRDNGRYKAAAEIEPRKLQAHFGGWGRRITQQIFVRGGSAPRSNPLPFYMP